MMNSSKPGCAAVGGGGVGGGGGGATFPVSVCGLPVRLHAVVRKPWVYSQGSLSHRLHSAGGGESWAALTDLRSDEADERRKKM